MLPTPTTEASAPLGTVTFLFTDIEGSTPLWEAHPREMRGALARHDALLHRAIAAHGGRVVKTMGDGLVAVFGAASDALAACLEAQRALKSAASAADDSNADRIDRAGTLALRVRMGLHTGEAEFRDGDYFGPALNRAARIMAAAHGEQILVSLATAEVVRGLLPAGVTLRELGEHQLKGIARPEPLLQVIVADLPADFPPLMCETAHPAPALPRPLTSFIGRVRELEEFAALLLHTRLLTLTAVGGSGKTRLAIELARNVQTSFPDGVWFVDLAPVAAADRVPLAVAATLGMREDTHGSIVDGLCGRLDTKRALIVLDNCEHLIVACAEFVRTLLSRTTETKILATSRQRLGVPGEQTVAVRPLGVASVGAGGVAGDISDAEQLFIDRARLAAPDFALTSETARAVRDICYGLEGLPLAIELAAARVKVLSVQEIAARLNDRFRLLTGRGSFEPRHQTLRGVIAWNYEQLGPQEQQAFRALAVFAGGWTLAAAAAVVGLSDEIEAIDMLSSLVDNSLVIVERDGISEPRYRMLETVRAYALEQLEAAGEAQAARDRHLRYYAGLVEDEQRPHGSPRDLYQRLGPEFDNLMAARDWCDQLPDGAEAGLRLAVALSYVLRDRAHPRIAGAMLERALNRPGAPSSGSALAHALEQAGTCAGDVGDCDGAIRLLERALAAAHDAGDTYRRISCMRRLGSFIGDAGDSKRAREYLAQTLTLGRIHGANYEVTAALNNFGELCRIEQRPDEAGIYYEQALAISREHGFATSNMLLNLAIVANERADFSLAARYVREAAAEIKAKAPRSRYDEVWLPEHAAALAASVGDAEFAARMWGALDAVCGESGLSLQAADVEFVTTRIERARAMLGDESFTEARTAGRALSLDLAIAEMDAWLERFLADD